MRRSTAALLVTTALVALGLVAGASLVTGRTDDAKERSTSRETRVIEAEAEAEGSNADDDDTEDPITGPDLARASEVALEHLGEGLVTDTEIEDEESYYEVEVTLDDGRQVDVQLDEDFNVVAATADEEGDE